MRLICFTVLLIILSVLVSPDRLVAQNNSFIKPKSVSIPAPEYPKEALDAGWGGRVIVEILVDKSGKVSVETAYGPNAPCSNLKDMNDSKDK